MVSHTLAFHRSSQVCSDPAILELIRAMELKRPVFLSLTPKWDLAHVLWSFTKSPYGHLDQSSLQFLTWKAAFLLTMASAKPKSKIHALLVETRHLRFNSSESSVTLLCQQEFLAKNQLTSMASKSFKVKSLSKTCGQDDEDSFLCPVRALKFYLNKLSPFEVLGKESSFLLRGRWVCGYYLPMGGFYNQKGIFLPLIERFIFSQG